jgi:glycosyltransferase involved in cell wall biosynthesis
MGGAEIALCRLLDVLDRRRCLPIVCLFEDGPLRNRLLAANVEVHVVPLDPAVLAIRKHAVTAGWILRPAKLLAVVRHAHRIARLIGDRDVDLVHTNSLKAHVVGAVAARLARRPLVWHLHTRIAADYLPRFAVACLRYGSRFIPDRVICNSRATLATVRPGPGRAAVIFPGMPAAGTEGPPAVALAGGRPGGPVTVGIVGVLSAFKGQDVFLRAAALLRPRFPDVRFLIVGATLFGEQAYEATLHRLVSDLGLSDVVTFAGYRTDAVALMRDLAVVVHASRTPEPFGQVLIEAMGTGRPVVATAGGGVAEVVVAGVTGLIVPPNDPPALASAIGTVLSDPAAAATMGRAGQARVAARFGIARTAARMHRLYAGLLGTGRSVPPAVNRPASPPIPAQSPKPTRIAG